MSNKYLFYLCLKISLFFVAIKPNKAKKGLNKIADKKCPERIEANMIINNVILNTLFLQFKNINNLIEKIINTPNPKNPKL